MTVYAFALTDMANQELHGFIRAESEEAAHTRAPLPELKRLGRIRIWNTDEEGDWAEEHLAHIRSSPRDMLVTRIDWLGRGPRLPD